MKFYKYDTLVDALASLQQRGYTDNYKFEEDQMHGIETGRQYSADEMTIVEYHRFEGESNPSDMSIVFAVESNDGRRGTLTSSYGAYADHKMLNFISKVRIKETGEFRINKKMAG
ncbi:MAG TPA: hypothetical protein PKE06_21190 [Flavilitoribacter sp.]|nr:hypothetical protein [Lewinella sp.]HMQ63213.1 hypothetical protein [Flavilitoribacter sp.]HMQ87468.1 hypothetical protein [Flavilitoribacter sp.]